MELFHEIEGYTVIIHSRGTFKQVKLYRRGVELFAGYAGGFVRLMAMNGTSNPNVSWVETDVHFVLNKFQAPTLPILRGAILVEGRHYDTASISNGNIQTSGQGTTSTT